MQKLVHMAPGKINLFLSVGNRRSDGHHRVTTAMIKVALWDTLTWTPGDAEEIRIEVPGFPELETHSNLAVRAARLYAERRGRPAGGTLRIDKRIPMGGGMGGGSSDAAAVLRLMNGIYGDFSLTELSSSAALLGADVPFFVHDASIALATGTGEVIHPWPSLPVRFVVLVNPGFPVSTADAYRALGRPLTCEGADDNGPSLPREPENWSDLKQLMEIGNDLQPAVEADHPGVRQVREALERTGAEAVRMTGSGSTVFGFFGSQDAARAASRDMAGRWPSWATRTLP